MSRLPLCSSRQVAQALARLGFTRKDTSGGSHQSWIKSKPAGGHWVAIVPAGKRELPRGTLKSILDQAGLTENEFLKHL